MELTTNYQSRGGMQKSFKGHRILFIMLNINIFSNY